MLELLTTEKVVGCELKIEQNVCHLWLMDEDTASVAEPKWELAYISWA